MTTVVLRNRSSHRFIGKSGTKYILEKDKPLPVEFPYDFNNIELEKPAYIQVLGFGMPSQEITPPPLSYHKYIPSDRKDNVQNPRGRAGSNNIEAMSRRAEAQLELSRQDSNPKQEELDEIQDSSLTELLSDLNMNLSEDEDSETEESEVAEETEEEIPAVRVKKKKRHI